MVLFFLRKLILQTCMHSHPVGLDVLFFVKHFVYFHTSCLRTVKALARLRACAGSPEPSLVAYVISSIISWAQRPLVCKVSTWTAAPWRLQKNYKELLKELQIRHTDQSLSYHNDPKFIRSGQTVYIQIRLLLKDPSDQGLHCLPLLYGKISLFKF